jgi:hypothetical protein
LPKWGKKEIRGDIRDLFRKPKDPGNPRIHQRMYRAAHDRMGDQLRRGLLADTPMMDLTHALKQGAEITLVGTSKQPSWVISMIAGGGSGESPNRAVVDMATGLGMIPGSNCRSTPHNRNRTARLMSARGCRPSGNWGSALMKIPATV